MLDYNNISDWFYTINKEEGDHAVKNLGYVALDFAVFVYPVDFQPPLTVPFFRFYSPDKDEHFYTTKTQGEHLSSYRAEGEAGYVFDPQLPQPFGTVTLFRWFKDGRGHFYTTALNGEEAPEAGFTRERTACYVFDNKQPSTCPLYRYYKPIGPDFPSERDPRPPIFPPVPSPP